jgi:glycosyltransferase involved in cell wall biosynthesis
MSMPAIVHITADFPDPLRPDKTSAIRSLIDASPGFRHIVYSLNRVSARPGIQALRFAEDRLAVAYAAPPWGMMLATRLGAVAAWILDDLSAQRVHPDLVQAHKLTIEGLVAAPIARHYGIPLLCSVQAKTDVKVLHARLDLRSRYRKIWHEARHVLPFSPRASGTFTEVLGRRSGPTTVLPCITSSDAIGPAEVARRHRIVSVFRLDGYKRKNAKTLIKAVQAALRWIPDLSLDIYGSGPPRAFLELGTIIRRHSAERIVHLKGPIPHEYVQDTIRQYSAFAMPTLRESYGMVFAEALLAGVPILQTKGWGLHGLFADADVGHACENPRSYEEVAQGIVDLVTREAQLKSNIARLQRDGHFDLLRRDHIAGTYRGILEGVLGSSRVARPAESSAAPGPMASSLEGGDRASSVSIAAGLS